MLKSISQKDAIVLYWELPKNYESIKEYAVLCGGKVVGTTQKSHLEIGGLLADTAYTYSLVAKLNDGSEMILEEITAKTEPIKKIIDITAAPYFAVGDGVTLNTKKIQQAINDCKENECVYIPAGDFMTGSLFLHSDMELYLEKGAVIHGTQNIEDYSPKIKSRFEGYEMMTYAGLINIGELDRQKGYNCKNVRICGEGTIRGGGRPLMDNVIALESVLMKDYIVSLGDSITEHEAKFTVPARVRPRLINMSCAQNVVMWGVNAEYGPSWNIHMIYCDNIVTYKTVIRSENVNNGDGWDPDSSTNCTLFAAEFFTGDDAVAIKSGKNPEGNIINIPCEHIRVFDCISHYGHGLTIGSEMSGGVSDVKVWNCDMGNSLYGFEIKGTKKRGGYVRDVHVKNCKLCRILLHSVPYNDDGEAGPTAPIFENCSFENMHLTAKMMNIYNGNKIEYCNAITIEGFDVPGHFVKNVKFKNIVVDNGEDSHRQFFAMQRCEGICFENICCK